MRLRHSLVGDGNLMGVIGAAADKPFLGVERGNFRLGKEAQEPFYFGHHLGADAIPGKQKELVTSHKSRLRNDSGRIAKAR